MFKVVFPLFSNIIQGIQLAYSTLDCVLNSQSDFDWVLYKHDWEFPIHEEKIPMLTFPIVVAAIFETDLGGLGENGDNADKKILFMHKNDYKWQGRSVTFRQL